MFTTGVYHRRESDQKMNRKSKACIETKKLAVGLVLGALA
jgi:hypothetical protein